MRNRPHVRISAHVYNNHSPSERVNYHEECYQTGKHHSQTRIEVLYYSLPLAKLAIHIRLTRHDKQRVLTCDPHAFHHSMTQPNQDEQLKNARVD